MRWSLPLAVALLSACGASEVQSQKLKDGSWSFQCELPMDECVRRVQEKCPNQRYRIEEGTSETRLRDAPPFERAYHTSRLRLTCTNGGAEPLITLGGEPKPAAAPPSSIPASSAAPPLAPSSVCSRGQTRECVGSGACKGGQACLADGSGFSACDCGPSTPPAEAPAAPSSTPSSSPTAPAP